MASRGLMPSRSRSRSASSTGAGLGAARRGSARRRRTGAGRPGRRGRRGLALQPLQHLPGAGDHGGGHAGQLGHLHAVGAVGGTRAGLVQEDQVAVPLLGPQREVGDVGQPRPPARPARDSGWRRARGSGWCRAAPRRRPRRWRGRRRWRCRGRSRPGSRSERGVAWVRMAAVSTISAMKVERPRARSSPAPTRLNRRSTTPSRSALGRHEAAGLGEDRPAARSGAGRSTCRPCSGR